MAGSIETKSIPGLSGKAKEAVSAVFEAMTVWQNETAKVGEKNARQVFDKMSKAAAALGWPEQVVETARGQMQAVAEMQNKTMEHIQSVWEEQLKSPNPMATSPEAMLSKLKSMPGFGPTSNWPNAGALQAAATAPLALCIEFGKQWQTFWTDALENAKKG